jgi:hypothetical protein
MDAVQRTLHRPKKECSATVSKDTPLHTAFTAPRFWLLSAIRVVALKLKEKYEPNRTIKKTHQGNEEPRAIITVWSQ